MKIRPSAALGRDIRSEDAEGLARSTWDEVRAAIEEGRADDALHGIDYGCAEAKMMHDSMCSFADDALTRLAEVAGDGEVERLLRKRYQPLISSWLAKTPDVKQSLERGIEFQRGHFGHTSVKEEADRYVVTCDPCGSGGRLRRTKKVARVKDAHDWTWNKKDVPYYCTHCAIMWEILPTQARGFPIRINLPPENDHDPCVHLYYKTPEAIPEQYFERISRSRLPAGSAPLKFHPPKKV
ncbi:MAG: hypothetical protein IT531_12515 [Burkholderiales bacterium]|nr:hypothetical protein [Burkholderiales bacterium]